MSLEKAVADNTAAILKLIETFSGCKLPTPATQPLASPTPHPQQPAAPAVEDKTTAAFYDKQLRPRFLALYKAAASQEKAKALLAQFAVATLKDLQPAQYAACDAAISEIEKSFPPA